MNNASIRENFYWHKPGTPLSGRILRVRVQMSVSRKWCLVTQCLQFGHFWDSFETFKSASDWVSEVLGDAMFAKLIKPSAVWVWDTGRWVPLSWKPNSIQPTLILYNCKKREGWQGRENYKNTVCLLSGMSEGKEERGQLKTGNDLEGHIMARRDYNEMENQNTRLPHEETEADLQKLSWTSNFLISIFIFEPKSQRVFNRSKCLILGTFWEFHLKVLKPNFDEQH